MCDKLTGFGPMYEWMLTSEQITGRLQADYRQITASPRPGHQPVYRLEQRLESMTGCITTVIYTNKHVHIYLQIV